MFRPGFLVLVMLAAISPACSEQETEEECDDGSVYLNIDEIPDGVTHHTISKRSPHQSQCQGSKVDTICELYNKEDRLILLEEPVNLDKDGNKYIFFYVTPHEGFNLRRDVYMRLAIMLTEAHKRGEYLEWKLVLPPWRRMYHWLTPERDQKWVQLPWGKFFDIDSFKSYAPVVELYEVFSNHLANHLTIDVHFNIKAYNDPFEGGTFVEKYQLKDCNCDYEGTYFGYTNISATKVMDLEFQGKVSMLWKVINQVPDARSVVFAHAEIPLHDNYGNKAFWDCRRSMKFNNKLVKIADHFIERVLGCNMTHCENYVSVHWRRQDFVLLRKDTPSTASTLNQIHRFMREWHIKTKNIFIASDSAEEYNILSMELFRLGYNVFCYNPPLSVRQDIKDGGIAIVDQIICSRASYFIGSHESAFTYRIYEERELLGFPPMSTFNRLCPDSGKCEKPAQWRAMR